MNNTSSNMRGAPPAQKAEQDLYNRASLKNTLDKSDGLAKLQGPNWIEQKRNEDIMKKQEQM